MHYGLGALGHWTEDRGGGTCASWGCKCKLSLSRFRHAASPRRRAHGRTREAPLFPEARGHSIYIGTCRAFHPLQMATRRHLLIPTATRRRPTPTTARRTTAVRAALRKMMRSMKTRTARRRRRARRRRMTTTTTRGRRTKEKVPPVIWLWGPCPPARARPAARRPSNQQELARVAQRPAIRHEWRQRRQQVEVRTASACASRHGGLQDFGGAAS